MSGASTSSSSWVPDYTVKYNQVGFTLDISKHHTGMDVSNTLLLATSIHNKLYAVDNTHRIKTYMTVQTAWAFIVSQGDQFSVEEFLAITCPSDNLFKEFMMQFYKHGFEQWQAKNSKCTINSDLSSILAQLSFSVNTVCTSVNVMSQNMLNLQSTIQAQNASKKSKISKYPPIYNPKLHNSMLSFGTHEFSRWALTQSLSDKESTLFFCLCFESKIECDHVDMLARDSDGSAKFNEIVKLIDTVIKELSFKEESSTTLQSKFVNFKLNNSSSLQFQFLNLSETRRMGWPTEDKSTCLDRVKEKFILILNMNDNMHQTIYFHSNLDQWKNATTSYEISTQIREVVQRFSRMPQSLPNQTSSVRKNPNAMDTNNVDSAAQQSIDNSTIVSKKCQNSKCGKTFKPDKPWFKFCNPGCMPPKSDSRKKSSSKKNGRKGYTNNIEESNAMSSSSEVSDKKFYKCQTFIDNCDNTDIPIIIYDSLYDTGSGPTNITLSTLKKWKLDDKVEYLPDDTVVNGGDQRPMEGFLGYINLKVALEDSNLNLTKYVHHRFYVFENLNHDILIGQDLMSKLCVRFIMFPSIDTLLLNPSSKCIRSFTKKQQRSGKN